MLFWIINCLFAFLFSMFCAGIVIPQILLIAFRKQLFDVPNENKVHKNEVPRLGGMAFKPVIFFTIALVIGVTQLMAYSDVVDQLSKEGCTLSFGFCSMILLYLLGMADDLIGIRYRAKFVVQLLCSVMLIAGGLYLNNLYGFLFINEMPLWISYIFTVLVIILTINSINLIDGIDGLASGLCSIAFLFYGIFFFVFEEYIYSLISFATLGVFIPFFYYNVFGDATKQKKIFMGDTGSLTIGILICILSLKMGSSVSSSELNAFNPMVLAFSPVIVPCFDVVRVYFHRLRNNKNPFLPDRNHIHHKLLGLGMKQHVAMMTIILISILFTLLNIALSKYVPLTLIVILDIVIYILGNVWLTSKIRSRGK